MNTSVGPQEEVNAGGLKYLTDSIIDGVILKKGKVANIDRASALERKCQYLLLKRQEERKV